MSNVINKPFVIKNGLSINNSGTDVQTIGSDGIVNPLCITNIGSSSGNTTVNNNLVVTGNLDVKGSTTVVESTTVQIQDKNIEIGSTSSPTNVTADGGGITLKGATDKTFNWLNSNSAWNSSENLNLLTGKTYKINSIDVLSSTTLGSSITSSSLTSVGTITSGTWHASTIATNYGGTGIASTPTNGQLLIGNGSGYSLNALTGTTNQVNVSNGSGSITLSLPQSIGTSSSPTFNAVTVNALNLTNGSGTSTIQWNPTYGTFDVPMTSSVTLQMGQEMFVYAKATEAISNGQTVMFAGAQGSHILVSKATNAVLGANTKYFVGVATSDIPVNGFGYITWFGNVNGLNTSAWTEGTILYFDPTVAGGLTSTIPTAPNPRITVAAVTNSHSQQGTILVRPSFGYKISELQDVSFSSGASGDMLQYDGTKWNNVNYVSANISSLDI